MEEKKLISPAKLKFCKFLDDGLTVQNDYSVNYFDSGDNQYLSDETTYKRELALRKRVCHCCGKEVFVDTPTSMFEIANNDSKYVCDECKNDKDRNTSITNRRNSFIDERRRSVLAGFINSTIVYAIFILIAFLLVKNLSTKNILFMISPIIFYSIFSLVYCLVGDVAPVHSVFSGGFGWVGTAFAKPFSSGSGFLIIVFILCFPYVLAFFALVSVAIIAITFVLSICVCPFSLISRYRRY